MVQNGDTTIKKMLEKKLLATSLIIKVYVKKNKDERKDLNGTASISKTFASNYR